MKKHSNAKNLFINRPKPNYSMICVMIVYVNPSPKYLILCQFCHIYFKHTNIV